MNSFLWHARVYYEDTDAGGVVYYANYLKYMERARTEWLRCLGVEQDELSIKMNILFAVRSVNIEYKQPARFNDALEISVEPMALKSASISFQQTITKQHDDSVLATAQVNVVCLSSSDFKPQAIPKSLHMKIQQGETNNAC